MAKTVYTVASVELTLNNIRDSFRYLGISIPRYRVLASKENQFVLLDQEDEGKATPVSGSSLNRLQTQLFGPEGEGLGLLRKSRPTSEKAFQYAEKLAAEEEEQRRKEEEERLAREADAASRAAREAALEGAGVSEEEAELLKKLRSLDKNALDALFDKADGV